LRVYNPEKVGIDAGTIAGTAPTGVLGTDDVDEILAMDADCVSYCPLATTTGSIEEALDDLCRILASGKNVVAPSMAYFMYPPLVGGMATQEGFDRIEAACKEGGTSIHIAGASPGYVHDWVPLALTKASRSIERIELSEVVSLRGLPKRQILCDYMGFGLPVDYDPLFFRQLAVVNDNPYHLPLRMLADHTRLELDNVTWEREVALAPSEFETAAGSFPAGGMAATRGVLTGWWRERPAITMTFVWRLSHEVAPEWPVEDSWTVKIVGDPTIEADLKVTTAFGTGRPVSIVSATVPLNAVPAVCEATDPGIKTAFDLPFDGGGYWA
jgi:4-hydroxy-tetrahydrodipicolinate reductase